MSSDIRDVEGSDSELSPRAKNRSDYNATVSEIDLFFSRPIQHFHTHILGANTLEVKCSDIN